MDAEIIIDRLGGPTKVAELCDCTPQAVSQWFGFEPVDPEKPDDPPKRREIPKARLMYLKAVRPEVFAENWAPAEQGA